MLTQHHFPTMREFRENLAWFVNETNKPDHKTVVIMKYSKPCAVLISPEEYEKLEEQKKYKKQGKVSSSHTTRKAAIAKEIDTMEKKLADLWKGKNKNLIITNEDVDAHSY